MAHIQPLLKIYIIHTAHIRSSEGRVGPTKLKNHDVDGRSRFFSWLCPHISTFAIKNLPQMQNPAKSKKGLKGRGVYALKKNHTCASRLPAYGEMANQTFPALAGRKKPHLIHLIH